MERTARPPKKGKTFPPCSLCKEPVRFAWTCSCGYAMCTPCLDNEEVIARTKWNGRTWACPVCGLAHMGQNR
ncbi:hypothetical protein [Magnetococcus marinus]|uniref:hypothetical protein n=1 Tax=Magnetococcus marinus TaxID=1124597 RepID=UPI0000381BAD|nr:hypothetical protein [Magnetococcus marinus]